MKNYFFFVDDNIWFFRDLVKSGANSLFDNEYLSFYRDLHEKYGTKIQFNVFYQTDESYQTEEFCLSQMTDKYKDEWKSNSDWLRLAFHANQEFPEYPYVNVSYDQMKTECSRIQNEIIRFAGEQTLSHNVISHFLPVSFQGCKALKDLGTTTLAASWGDEETTDENLSMLSSSDCERLFQNRTDDTSWVYAKHLSDGSDILSLKSYNHLPEKLAAKYQGTNKFYQDEKTGLYFKRYGDIVLNSHEPALIPELLAEKLSYDFIGIAIHEQYFYKDYFNYEPNYRERVETGIKFVTDHGYNTVFLNELL